MTAGVKIAKCASCKLKMLVKEYGDEFQGYIDVKSEDDQALRLLI